MNDQRFAYKLPSGETVQVDERIYIALLQLESAMCLLAAGGTSCFAILEVDVEGRDRSFALLGEHLEILHKELLVQSNSILDAAKAWKGNAPPENQSRSRH